MALWPNFCAGAYQMRSAQLDAEACINLYVETVESSVNAKKSVLYATPGLIPMTTVTDTGCRGMFSQDGRTFAVIGPTLYELSLSGSGSGLVVTAISRATVANDSGRVYFASNGLGGNQLAISSAGKLYIYNLNTNAISTPTLPLTNAAGPVLFLNTYFLLLEVNSLRTWFSELEDGTKWDGLDFFTRSNTSDNVVGFVSIHDQIRTFGGKTSELIYNVGEADNPFLPYPGSVSLDGAVTASAIGVIGENVIWLSRNERNVIRVQMAGVGETRVVSTPAIEFALASYATVTDCELETYEQEGHSFAIFNFPTADVSWAFDVKEGQWHQRLRWDNTAGLFHVWRVRGICSPGSQILLCGDRTTGNIYQLSLDRFDENCALVKRLRRAPYLSAENQWLFLDQIELGTQPGVGLAGSGTGSQSNVTLRISRDGGNTYSPSLTASEGTQNSFLARAIWRRLGRARSDRLVIEVSKTDPTRTVWGPGLWLRAQPGSGEL